MNALKKIYKAGRALGTMLTSPDQFEDNDGMVLRLCATLVTAAAEVVEPYADEKIPRALRNLGSVFDRKGD